MVFACFGHFVRLLQGFHQCARRLENCGLMFLIELAKKSQMLF
jgi:hypothetical protein